MGVSVHWSDFTFIATFVFTWQVQH